MLIVFFISVKLANFKYNNFMYGKFDLGNMSQVVWNNKHGNFNMVTDQFGNDISRLGMSHVDLTLFVVTPLYFIKEDPRLLIFFQQFVVEKLCTRQKSKGSCKIRKCAGHFKVSFRMIEDRGLSLSVFAYRRIEDQGLSLRLLKFMKLKSSILYNN